jgi:DNA-binding NtrC family response regulator
MTRVLIVDDDPVQLRLTAAVAERGGFVPITATGGEAALIILRSDPGIAAVILDLVMPDLDGMAVLEAMARENLRAPVIVQTASSSLETVVTAMRRGAVDFFVKPVAPERLLVSLGNALNLRALQSVVRAERHRRAGTLVSADMIAESPAMDRLMALCAKAARSTIPVMVEGETGVGKELAARVIHGQSDRAGKPFVTVNCGAIPPDLVQSTLFGHRKGAFPGATSDARGKFAEAHGGTLFLDEIGELPLEAQAKLLRAIESGEIEPLGATRPERANARVISAASRRLLNLTRAGGFREDLYYRLSVFPIYVPPLRQRREDIPALVAHFIARFSAESERRVGAISPEALALLAGYDWPGNVRQLENAVYRAVVLCEGDRLEPADFPQILARAAGRADAIRLTETLPLPSGPVHIDAAIAPPRRTEAEPVGIATDRFLTAEGEVTPLEELERALIAFALDHYAGRMSKVARALGIGRSTLYRKLREYGLDAEVQSDAA